MNHKKFSFLLLAFISAHILAVRFPKSSEELDLEYYFSGNFRPESFFGKNITLLNNNNPDINWYSRHTLDLNLDVVFGQNMCDGDPIAEFVFSARNKAVWGHPVSICPTTIATSKSNDVVDRKHNHFIPRLFFWMREVWLEFSINKVFKLSFANEHTFKMGAFPFQVGRGISLGPAFAVGPGSLGFYTDRNIDQFAFGFKLSGEFVHDHLFYDIYASILQNKMVSLRQTAQNIYGQEFDNNINRLFCPERGTGKINQIWAARLRSILMESKETGRFYVEPYIVFNNNPELKIEFPADSSCLLATLGTAVNYDQGSFIFNMEFALNVGSQKVKGWDRNEIISINRDGLKTFVNSKVIDQNDQQVLFIKGSDAQKIIDMSDRCESENGKQIGEVPSLGFIDQPVDLFNADNRFRNPFTNSFKGWMFVADVAYWVYKRDLLWALAVGVASGGSNPMHETKDQDFGGFIGLQEIYSGSYVRSAFVLGSQGKVLRPYAQPKSKQAPTKQAQAVNGFTNLVYAGSSLHWEPESWDNSISIQPDILFYWQETATPKYDCKTKQDLPQCARNFLGTELNIFASYWFYENFRIYNVSSIFVPGGHFTDIKGKPISPAQEKALDRLDRTGFDDSNIPNIGDDVAFTFNIGLEFKF